MKASDHHGVVLVLTNPARSHFLLQRKDSSYPHFPRGYSFFGGALEDEETEEVGLQRELEEEFPEDVCRFLSVKRERIFSGFIETEQVRFQISLYESTLTDEELQMIANAPVLEGESADLIAREQLKNLPFVWGLEQLVPTLLRSD